MPHSLFAELFGAPKKELFFCGLTGAIGWVVYVIGKRRYGHGACESDRHFRAHRIFPYSVRGPQKSGDHLPDRRYFPAGSRAGIYYTSYYFIMNDMPQFSNYGMETIKVAGAIVLGIVFGFGLPQSWFNALQRIERKKTAL